LKEDNDEKCRKRWGGRNLVRVVWEKGKGKELRISTKLMNNNRRKYIKEEQNEKPNIDYSKFFFSFISC
jgi:hypothetical protein